MSIRQKFGVLAATVLVAGTLLTGAAYAADPMPEPALQTKALSEGEKQVMEQLRDLRKNYKEKFKADADALIDQAVQKGTITKQQADALKARHQKHAWGKKWHRMSQEELTQKLDEAVKAGKLTPEQAAHMLERHAQHHGEKQE
jgi:polyhydroxyalkanoate synthesis regulator phasin